MRLVVATKNPDKAEEMLAVLRRVLPGIEPVEGLDWPDVDETGSSLEENAVIKARAVASHTGHPTVADDTGLEVDALGGAPGVLTSRFAGEDATYEDNRRALLSAIEGRADRTARFRTVVAFVDPSGEVVVAEGVLEGSIAHDARGDGGFGYDPVFEVDGRTLAEIGVTEKNRISHRARALEALAARLR